MSLEASDSYKLIEQYLDICRSAMAANKDRFPFKQIFAGLSDERVNRIVAVYIHEESSVLPLGIKVRGGNFILEEGLPSSPCKIWRVSREYLEQVLSEPLSYINNPAKIDWDWVY